jgi:cytochrome P450
MKAVIDETLRLMPPVPAVARMTINSDNIGGFEIDPGVTVVCQPWVTHRDERWWKEPRMWNPERFIGRPERKDDFTFFPFARGPRACIGEELARTEAVLILTSLVERYEWKLSPGFVPNPVHHLTLQSKNGMKVILKKRAV